MIVITNGYLIDPSVGVEGEFDLLIDGGVVSAIEKPGSFSKLGDVKKTIDAKGKWILPGLVDLHVHLREPGFEWKETVKTGVSAAVAGGFTSICCMPNTRPTNDSAEITKFVLEKAAEAKGARVWPIGAVSLALKGDDMAPLSELKEAGCVAFSDDGEPVWDPALMRRALEWCKMLGVTISCHEEDKKLSCGGVMNESPLSAKLGLRGMPKVAEEVMISRDIELARATKGKVHICHVSTARGVELIRRAKNDGIQITAEVTPHHLLLTEDAVEGYNTAAKMSPPLREQEDCDALISGLKDGTIDAVASDHAPHENDSKEVEYSKATFGILGLQTTLPLLIELVENGKIPRTRAISAMTHGPAKAFGLNVGKLSKGSFADIAIVNPKASWVFTKEEILSLSLNSPFIGRTLTGKAEIVFVNGKEV